MNSCRSLLALSLVVAASGCASIISGSTQTVSLMPMRGNQIDSDATCTAWNNKGKWVASGGNQVVVEKSRQDLQVECVDPKTNETASASGPRSTHARWMAANFFLWDLCTFSCLIDFSTGSIYAYPTQVQIEMPERADVK